MMRVVTVTCLLGAVVIVLQESGACRTFPPLSALDEHMLSA